MCITTIDLDLAHTEHTRHRSTANSASCVATVEARDGCVEVGLCFSQLPVGLDLWANRLADVPASTHTHAINLCEAYYRRARGQLRTRDPPSCSCPERSNLHLRRAQKCVSGGSTGPCSAGWWPRTVRLGEVMVHARVLLRLRGRKERDHHEQGSIQHRVGLVRGS